MCHRLKSFLLCICLALPAVLGATSYFPEGKGIACVNGTNRFNRAIYGTNSGFRFETSDFPEIGLYMPNMGGSVYFAIRSGGEVKWIRDAEMVKSVYTAGSRRYEVRDSRMMGKGCLEMEMLAWADADGVVVSLEGKDLPEDFSLLAFFGGATDVHFRREGDLGADPADSFYIKPDNCTGNAFTIVKNTFYWDYGIGKRLYGVMPQETEFRTLDASFIDGSLTDLISSSESARPLLMAEFNLGAETLYMGVVNPLSTTPEAAVNLKSHFRMADEYRDAVAGKVSLNTPDKYLNPVGGNLAMAADAVWQTPVYHHGAIGWRIPLVGWRHCYIGDFLGWPERSRSHFDYYADLQMTNMPDKPVTMDSRNSKSTYLIGTPLYSSGYIANCQGRARHLYDMNLIYIDALMWHLRWTGDLEYAKKMWPLIERHLAWEKCNFDGDGNSLYDAQCCIWASDAVQYSGGDVTHSSAYNYRANKMAAEIAELIGEDGTPYREEAERIKKAIDEKLWLSDKGWWAEYRGTIANREAHESAAAWTFYHAVDSELSEDNLQGYQAARYAVKGLVHIPVPDPEGGNSGYSVISTTDWMPYVYSVNNVALAESAHTALALFETGMNEEAYKLMKGAILDVMYDGVCPGNFGMTTKYNITGAAYRDFSDGIGVFSRLLVQGLFGITPDALKGKISIIPGFPEDWDEASLETSDVALSFERSGRTDRYVLRQKNGNELSPVFRLTAYFDKVKSVKVNGKVCRGKFVKYVGKPIYELRCPAGNETVVEIEWGGKPVQAASYDSVAAFGEPFEVRLGEAQSLAGICDPQGMLQNVSRGKKGFSGTVSGVEGDRTMFAEVRQGDAVWLLPVEVEVRERLEVVPSEEYQDKIGFRFRNNTDNVKIVGYSVNGRDCGKLEIAPRSVSEECFVTNDIAVMGTNRIVAVSDDGDEMRGEVVNWNLKNSTESRYETVDISNVYNDRVSQIYRHSYKTPRTIYTTLQLPIHGYGNWCAKESNPNISEKCFGDALEGGILQTSAGVPFLADDGKNRNNIVFTSLWDNFPDSVTVKLAGKARHAYLLMAGSTNHMQSQFRNGVVTVRYKDGSTDELKLVNPDTWVSIEQDMYRDEYAFRIDRPVPYRVLLKDGMCTRDLTKDCGLQMKAGRFIDGGAAVILDLPLDGEKELDSLVLKTTAYEVVIGLMSVTLVK